MAHSETKIEKGDTSQKSKTPDHIEQQDLGDKNRGLWQGWSLSAETGFHFKTLFDADFSHAKSVFGHDKRFWGEYGVLGSLGFKYSRIFLKQGYWGIRTMWTFFYPDVRWEGERSKITLATIPFIGKYISFGDVPGYYTMLIPIIYFDIGYITKQGILFALGSAYLWGLSPSVSIPFDDHWSLEFRSTIFLDRIIFNTGFHNFLSGVGVNYKF